MMKYPDRMSVERIRKEYPVGCQVELVCIDNVQDMRNGMRGTVLEVDGKGNVLVQWNNGSKLKMAYGEHVLKKVPAVRTVCYGETTEWDTRQDAEQFFLHAMMMSEGSEQSRYVKIYTELMMGLETCTDGEET